MPNTVEPTELGTGIVGGPILSATPISDKITRERVFNVAELRADGKDTLGQLLVVLAQLKFEQFTGEMSISMSQGGIQHLRVRQSQKVSL